MCLIGALKRSKYVHMYNMELTIKEMQMPEIQNIVVKLVRFRNYQQFNGRQLPPVFEVSNFKLILKHVFAYNFL